MFHGVPGAREEDIGIVEKTDTATHNISQGQYVIWKGKLYTASSAISIGNTLSSSNLTEKPNGLGDDVKTINESMIKNTDIVDNLTTNDATKVLSAKQGKVISDQIAQLIPLSTSQDTSKLPSDFPNGISIYNNNNIVEGGGCVLVVKLSDTRVNQICFDYYGNALIRGATNASTWSSWKKVTISTYNP